MRKNRPALEYGHDLPVSEILDYIENHGRIPRCAICGQPILPPEGRGLCFRFDPDTGKETEIWWCAGCIDMNLESTDIDWDSVQDAIREDEEGGSF